MTGKLTIGVLETGRPPEELNSFGNYPQMVAKWLGGLEAEFSSFAVLDGVLPDSPAAADLWVITGSKFGAYEDHPWIPPLEDFIRACRDAGQRMIGICFGHQIIAQALGGVVRKSGKGWGLGVHDYSTEDWPAELGPRPEKLSLQAWHQDQVEEAPKGARRIASSDFCENAALWYPGFAMTVQGHPEMEAPYSKALLTLRRGAVLPEDAADQGLADVTRPANPDELARLIKAHLKDI